MSRHIIRSFSIEIDSDSEERGHQLNQQINDYLLREVMPELERAMEEAGAGSAIWQIGKIEIDLGECTGPQFFDEFKNRLIFKFREALRSSLDGTPTEEAEAADKSDVHKSRLALFRHFLKYGTFPWWADEFITSGASSESQGGQTLSIKELVDVLLKEDAYAMQKLVRQLVPTSSVRQRIVRQLDDVRLKALLKNTEPALESAETFIQNILNATEDMAQGSSNIAAREQLWEQIIRSFILNNEPAEKAKNTIATNWLTNTLRASTANPLETVSELRSVLAKERGSVQDKDKTVWHEIQKAIEELFVEELPSQWRKVRNKQKIVDKLDPRRVTQVIQAASMSERRDIADFYARTSEKLSASSREQFTAFILDTVFGTRYGHISLRELLVETVSFFANSLSMSVETIVRYLAPAVTEEEAEAWSSSRDLTAEQVKELAEAEVLEEKDWRKWQNQDIISSFLLHGVIPWNERARMKDESLESIFNQWLESDPAGFARVLQKIDWQQKPFVVKRILNSFSPELADRLLERLPRTVAQLMSPPPLTLEALLASPHLTSHYLTLFARGTQWSPMEWGPGITVAHLLKAYMDDKPENLRLILQAFDPAQATQLRAAIKNMPKEALDNAEITTEEVDEVFDSALTGNTGNSEGEGLQVSIGSGASMLTEDVLKAWEEDVKNFLLQGKAESLEMLPHKVQTVLARSPITIARLVNSQDLSDETVKQWIKYLPEASLARLTYFMAGPDYQKGMDLAETIQKMDSTRAGISVKYKRWFPAISYFTNYRSRTFSTFQFAIRALDLIAPVPNEALTFITKLFASDSSPELREQYKRLAGLLAIAKETPSAISDFIKGKGTFPDSLDSPDSSDEQSESNRPLDSATVTDDQRPGTPQSSEKAGDESESTGQTDAENTLATNESPEANTLADQSVTEEGTATSDDPDSVQKESESEEEQDAVSEKKSKGQKESEEQPEKKKQPIKQPPAEEIPEPPEKEPIFISNAGLVILHPFITRLFSTLGLTANRKFIDEDSAHKAAHILHYLVYHSTEGQEHEMVLEKVLCNIPLGVPLKTGYVITDEEKDLCISLTKAAINYWEILKKSSVDNFRASFLIREGAIYYEGREWRLHVTPKGLDVLMEKLPWSIGMIRFPWMEKVLHVNWI